MEEPDGAAEETLLGNQAEKAGEQEKRREDSVINTQDPDQVRFQAVFLSIVKNRVKSMPIIVACQFEHQSMECLCPVFGAIQLLEELFYKAVVS